MGKCFLVLKTFSFPSLAVQHSRFTHISVIESCDKMLISDTREEI